MTKKIINCILQISIILGMGWPEVYSAELEKKYLGFLTAALNSTDVSIKTEAIRTLFEISSKTDKLLLQNIKKLLKDNSIQMRIESAKALSKFGDTSGVPVLFEIIKDRPKILPTDTAAKRALKLAKNLNRVKAIEAIGEIGIRTDTVLSLLRDIVRSKDEDAVVKDAAIVSLIKLGDRERIKTFIYALSNSDVNIKAKVCEVLSDVKAGEAKARIRELLKHFSKDVRSAACLALGKLGAKEYAAEIKELLNDREEIVRIAACESLGMLGEYIDDLKKMLDDKNGFVRLADCNSLLKLGDDSGRSFVVSSLSDEDTDAVIKAIQILANFGDNSVIDALENAFNSSRNELVEINIAGAILKILWKTQEIPSKSEPTRQ